MTEKTTTPGQPYPDSTGSVLFPLFRHMMDEHGITLLDSEMHEICRIVEQCAWTSPKTPPSVTGLILVWDGDMVEVVKVEENGYEFETDGSPTCPEEWTAWRYIEKPNSHVIGK